MRDTKFDGWTASVGRCHFMKTEDGKRKRRSTKHELAITRSDKSLKVVTEQIVDILKHSGRAITLAELGHITCKRRCYDVILVLEALGLVKRVAKKSVEWNEKTPEFDDSAISSYFSSYDD